LEYLLPKTVRCCQRTLSGEGHVATGWDIGGSVKLLLRVQKSVRLGNG